MKIMSKTINKLFVWLAIKARRNVTFSRCFVFNVWTKCIKWGEHHIFDVWNHKFKFHIGALNTFGDPSQVVPSDFKKKNNQQDRGINLHSLWNPEMTRLLVYHWNEENVGEFWNPTLQGTITYHTFRKGKSIIDRNSAGWDRDMWTLPWRVYLPRWASNSWISLRSVRPLFCIKRRKFYQMHLFTSQQPQGHIITALIMEVDHRHCASVPKSKTDTTTWERWYQKNNPTCD